MGILTEEELKERNRLLVLENDELNAQVIKLKAALNDIAHINTSSWYEDVNFMKNTAAHALEGLK